VEEPEAETRGRAELQLADVLSTRPEPSPEIVELCQAIRKSIREKRPVDEDELVEADPEEMAAQAGRELNDSVEGDAERVQDSYDELNEPQEGAPQLEPEPFETPPEEVAAPDPRAEEAIPDPVPAEDVSLEADLSQADADIEASGMRTEPAQLVQDGPIAQARSAHGELSDTAEARPAETLAKQDAALQQASADMADLQEQALAALTASRSNTVSGMGARQHRMVGTEKQMRARLSSQARKIFSDAQTRVNTLLRPLTQKAMNKWEAGVAQLSTQFRQSLNQVKSWIDERHSGLGGALLAGWDALTGLPDWVTEEYDRAEKEFGDGVCELIQEISAEVNSVIATCEELIDNARQEIDDLFTQNLPESLQGWAAAQRQRFQGQLNNLQNQVTKTRDDFHRDLSRRAVRAVREVQDEVQKLREEAKGLLGRIADAINAFLQDPIKFIIEGLLKLVGISPASFWALVNKVQQVIDDIADDPERFINNLVTAVGQGFQRFFDNIAKHLMQGFLDWLFGGLGAVGVELPADLSPKSIITFFLQLMGISWPRIRQILVRHIGEENVALIEKAWELLSVLIQQGPAGIYEMIKERLDPRQILNMVIDAAIDYLTSALIKNVTARVIALFNPVGAILQAIELIYKVLKWIFENAAKLFSFIETIVNGLADIIAGNISGMAKAVEKALAKLIPPVIDFFASLIGVGDLPDKVVETVKKLQDWVESILDRAIGWLVDKGRKLLAAVGLGGKKEPEKAKVGEGDAVLGTSVSFSAAGVAHRQWVDIRGTNAVLMVSSDRPQPVEDQLAKWESQLDEQFAGDKERRNQASGLISSAHTLLGQADTEADALVTAFRRANEVRGENVPEIPSDDTVEAKQQALSSILRQLFELFGEKPNVLESARSQLTERLGGRHSMDEAQRVIRSVYERLRPLGLHGLELSPETMHGEYAIIAEASPGAPLLSLIPESRGKTMRSIITITVEETGAGPLALEPQRLASGREVAAPRGAQVGLGLITRRGARGRESRYWLLEPVFTGALSALVAGGAVLEPEAGADKIQIVTWNTGDITRNVTNNATHAERQFYEWFIAQPPEWIDRVKRIEIENRPFSPCTACADNLTDLLRRTNPEVLKNATLVWRTPYRVGPLATRPDTLSGMRGWLVRPSTVPVEKEQYRISR
jgi:hypothetical protein